MRCRHNARRHNASHRPTSLPRMSTLFPCPLSWNYLRAGSMLTPTVRGRHKAPRPLSSTSLLSAELLCTWLTIMSRWFAVNAVVWLQSIGYKLQWSDPRLFTAACAGSVAQRSASQPSMFSASATESLSENSRASLFTTRRPYWTPHEMTFPSLMPRATLLNEFVTFTMPYIPLPRRGPRVVPQTAWLVNESSPNGPVPAHPNGTTTPVCACLLPPTLVAKCALLATLLIDMCFAASWQMCENCVTWEGAFEVELLQGHFKYAYCVLSGFATGAQRPLIGVAESGCC
jgi:hypothetical protein